MEGDGTCKYIKLADFDILELDPLNVDKVNDLWGFCLLGCFAGKFLGLKVVHNLAGT